MKKYHFLIIDDDNTIIEIYRKLLEAEGHTVTSMTSSIEALSHVVAINPDCILCDLLMPDIDGLELLTKIRKLKDVTQPKFIVITGKQFEFDRKQAFQLGADGYITKPINPQTFVEEILNIIDDHMAVKFWGVRGTFPVPGKNSIKYGGNTNCVTIEIGEKHFFILDAGTGIKALSNHLVEEKLASISAKIFITHPHYDHINGLPYFVPFYIKGNEFEIFGSSQGEHSIEKIISAQMDSVYFPVTMDEFSAKVSFRDLSEESFSIDDVQVRTIFLNHPGHCLGYRFEYKGKSVCYITDNELYLENSNLYNAYEVERLKKFIENTNLLIIDSTYTDEEYVKKVKWGHSSVSQSTILAHQAKVKTLCLFHHDPDQLDDDIDKKLAHAKKLLSMLHSNTHVIAPHENDIMSI